MANFEPLFWDFNGVLTQEDGTCEAEFYTIKTPSELDVILRDVPAFAVPGSTTVVEFVDWKVSSSCPNADHQHGLKVVPVEM
jgi:hypothetical protein